MLRVERKSLLRERLSILKMLTVDLLVLCLSLLRPRSYLLFLLTLSTSNTPVLYGSEVAGVQELSTEDGPATLVQAGVQNDEPLSALGRQKIIVRNHIAYHFKKVVREVSQELLISRKMDVNPLVIAAQALADTARTVDRYCNHLKVVDLSILNTNQMYPTLPTMPPTTATNKPASEVEEFIHLAGQDHDFEVARSLCLAKGRQLPEIYDEKTSKALIDFMKAKNIPYCVAGITHDLVNGIARFASTSIPVWNGYYRQAVWGKHTINLTSTLDDYGSLYLYTVNGTLSLQLNEHNAAVHGRLGHTKYRNDEHTLWFMIAPVVCQRKWDGRLKVVPYTEIAGVEAKIGPILKRDLAASEAKDRVAPDLKTSYEVCKSLASHANETYNNAWEELSDLLGQVDISMRSPDVNDHQRRKRFIGIIAKQAATLGARFAYKKLKPGRFKFSTGTRMAWNLFGVAQSAYSGVKLRKVSKIVKQNEANIASNTNRINQNSADIASMAKILEDNSLAISQIIVTTTELAEQIKALEGRVTIIEDNVGKLETRLQFDESMQLTDSLISRIGSALNIGLDRMREIIHSTLLGQTSPFLLPPDQIDLVQREVLKASAADLDTDFSRMQSVIVSDPEDPQLLLIVISAMALARRNRDLVQLIPVPGYGKTGTFIPKLSYTVVILDQLVNQYVVLDELEESNCLIGKCYVSNQARPIADGTCGIPQYNNRHLEACEFEEISSNGMFLKPLLPDGVLFSFQHKVSSQLFCNTDSPVGGPVTLEGAGVLTIPPGCKVNIYDSKDQTTIIKGLPIPHLIAAEDFSLISEEYFKSLQLAKDSTAVALSEGPNVRRQLQESVAIVRSQLTDVDNKIRGQHTHTWALTGVVIAAILATVILAYIIYRNFSTFQRKWRGLKVMMGNVANHINDVRRRLISDQTMTDVVWPVMRTPRSVLRRIRNRLSGLQALPQTDPDYVDMTDQQAKDMPSSVIQSPSIQRSEHAYPCDQLDRMQVYEAKVPPVVPPKRVGFRTAVLPQRAVGNPYAPSQFEPPEAFRESEYLNIESTEPRVPKME
jgi:hypothetical protein